MEPVGVAHSTPSHPNASTGRPSTSITESITRSGLFFSTLASLSAHVSVRTAPFHVALTSIVIRSSTW